MIVVDSSVWIAKLRGQPSAAVSKLDTVHNLSSIVLGDLVLLELLQGARDDHDAARIERNLRSFEVVRMVDLHIARRAATNFRMLRAKGLRLRATVDLVIGTFCIEHGHFLLHQDRDFDVMEEHLGLRVL